jgi:predicted Zn finger-like uncharacterized protein
MTPVETAKDTDFEAMCPLCHTIDKTVTHDSLEAGATWKCTRCGQTWSAERLETLAAYVRFDAARQLSLNAAR